MQNLEIIKAAANTPEWDAARMGGLGGSDCAAALGVSKWKSPYQLYLEKTGQAGGQADNWAMKKGRAMEGPILEAYGEQTGREVRVIRGIVRDPKKPFMFVNLDGFVVDGNRVVEAKTARSQKDWGEPGSDQVPQEYLFQVQHAMIITKGPVADIPVSFNGEEPVIYTVEADKELQEMIEAREEIFWAHVTRGVPPEPTTAEDVAKYYKEAVQATVTATPYIEEALKHLLLTRGNIEMLEGDKEQAETIIKKFLGENGADTLCSENGRILATWKEQKGAQRIDSKRLKSDRPEIYAAYSNIGESIRRLLLK